MLVKERRVRRKAVVEDKRMFLGLLHPEFPSPSGKCLSPVTAHFPWALDRTSTQWDVNNMVLPNTAQGRGELTATGFCKAESINGPQRDEISLKSGPADSTLQLRKCPGKPVTVRTGWDKETVGWAQWWLGLAELSLCVCAARGSYRHPEALH